MIQKIGFGRFGRLTREAWLRGRVYITLTLRREGGVIYMTPNVNKGKGVMTTLTLVRSIKV